MRYYDINIGNGAKLYTSFPGGVTDPGALNVEMDLPVYDYSAPLGGAYVRVWGISIQDVAQASNLNNLPITIKGGMQAGLPLANPAQANVLVQGMIQQAFGNWQGTTQTLDLVIIPGGASSMTAANVTLTWKKGTQLGPAIQQALTSAYPGTTVKVSLSPNLVFSEDQHGFYENATQLAQWANQASKAIIGGTTYQGVSIVRSGTTFTVSDGTQGVAPAKAIAFTDLIGQPTWLNVATINFKAVMRGDLSVGTVISMPQTVATTSASSYSQYRQSSIFQGQFSITAMRHVGNYRQPDANSWVTSIDAVIYNGGQ